MAARRFDHSSPRISLGPRLPLAALLATTLLLTIWASAGCDAFSSLTKPLTGEVRQTRTTGASMRRDLAIKDLDFDPIPYQKNENKGALDYFFAPSDYITFKMAVVNKGESTERQVQTEAFLYQTTSGGLPREVPSALVAEKNQVILELAPGQSKTVSFTFRGLKPYWQKSHLVARFNVAAPPGETETADNLRKVYFWILVGE